MVLGLGGAMSTGQLGLSLAEMIRKKKVHAISCTGANLEEELFGLVGRQDYLPVRDWRQLSLAQEQLMRDRRFYRVTDVCIPERTIELVEHELAAEWSAAEATPETRLFPHEFLYRLLRSGRLVRHYQIDPRDSWLLAAAEADLPLVVPGWEDSTLGNLYAARLLAGDLTCRTLMKTGIEYMMALAQWYESVAKVMDVRIGKDDSNRTAVGSVGFLQVGGGIAGDFAVCVVPLLRESLGRQKVPPWGYYCQVSDAVTSYGGYSGAIPSEKITWGKLAANTPMFSIESDAAIVVPLMFASVLGW